VKIYEYFDNLDSIIDKMTDEEFSSLLLSSGIEHCPYEETFNFDLKFDFAHVNKYVEPRAYKNDFINNIKVA
jgi:hypothetical protein